MSGKLDTANAFYEAFLRGDREAFLELLDDDVEWEIGAFLTGRESYRGKDEVREWWGEVEELSQDGSETVIPTFSRDEELPDGRLLRLGHTKILRAQDPVESDFGVLYTFRGEKISRLEVHMDHGEALRAAGLET